MSALKKCPRYYQYKYILQKSPSGGSVHLTFGIAFHSALELADKRRVEGVGPELIEAEVLDFCVKQTQLDRFQDSHKNRLTLSRACLWYLAQYTPDPLETVVLANGKAAVELSFKFELPDSCTPDGHPFLISGHLDKLVRMSGLVFILDRKTAKAELNRNYFAQWSPSNQMDTYYTAGRLALAQPIQGIIIDGAQIGVNFVRFARDILHRSKGNMEEWIDDTNWWMLQAQGFAETEFWPRNTKACNDYMSLAQGGSQGCEYRDVCSTDPATRQRLLSVMEDHLWNPLKSRED